MDEPRGFFINSSAPPRFIWSVHVHTTAVTLLSPWLLNNHLTLILPWNSSGRISQRPSSQQTDGAASHHDPTQRCSQRSQVFPAVQSVTQSTRDVSNWICSAVDLLFIPRPKLNIGGDFHGINRSLMITSLCVRKQQEPLSVGVDYVYLFYLTLPFTIWLEKTRAEKNSKISRVVILRLIIFPFDAVAIYCAFFS